MAIIVEDGTGKSDAESYISLANANTYHTDRGNAAWAGTDAVKEAALRKAAEYMFRYQWKGWRILAPQALDWPRGGVEAFGFLAANDSVPERVQWAQAELALRALSGPLVADLKQKKSSATVGPVSVSFEPGSREQTTYAVADGYVAPYTEPGTKLVRA